MLKKRKQGSLKSLLVLSVMAFYLLIASSHVFFLPRLTELQGTHSTAFNSVFKRKIESVRRSFNESSYVQRPDKSTLEEKKSVTDLISAVVSSFILLFFILQLWKSLPKPLIRSFRLTPGYQYTYLSLCTFRI
jgi:predicted PurR-regulated permease PerM